MIGNGALTTELSPLSQLQFKLHNHKPNLPVSRNGILTG